MSGQRKNRIFCVNEQKRTRLAWRQICCFVFLDEVKHTPELPCSIILPRSVKRTFINYAAKRSTFKTDADVSLHRKTATKASSRECSFLLKSPGFTHLWKWTKWYKQIGLLTSFLAETKDSSVHMFQSVFCFVWRVANESGPRNENCGAFTRNVFLSFFYFLRRQYRSFVHSFPMFVQWLFNAFTQWAYPISGNWKLQGVRKLFCLISTKTSAAVSTFNTRRNSVNPRNSLFGKLCCTNYHCQWKLFAATLVERWLLCISQPDLVVDLVALLHR